MNVLNRVTVKTLRRNRTRTLVTILGVILSAAMISAITTFIASMQQYLYDAAVAIEGRWETRLEQIPGKRAALLENDGDIKELGLIRNTGYALLEGCQNEDKPYLFVMDFSKEALSMLPVSLTEGRLPEREGEVVASRHISYNGGVNVEVGQTLPLNIGQRKTDEGKTCWQNTPYLGQEETLTGSRQQTVTVVGICDRPDFERYSAPGYTLIGYWDSSAMQPGDVVSAYMTMRNPRTIYETMERLEEQLGVMGSSFHGTVLRSMGVSLNDSFNQVLYGLGTILILLIIVGSIALIYNAFAISVSERSRQFGMLAGVGATSRQIYRSVLFEALVVGGVGIPLGLASGVAGIGITMHCLEGALGSLMEGVSSGGHASFHLVVSIPALVIAGLVALVTVLLSAWFPARRAAKNTAIDAVRQANDIRLRSRQVRGSRLVRRLFGIPADLALKNFRRNRRRYRATILSLVISLVLFISVSTFSQALQQSVGVAYQSTEADLVVMSATEKAEQPVELLGAVQGLEAVDKAVLYRAYNASVFLPDSAMDSSWMQGRSVYRDAKNGLIELDVTLIGMEDAAFSEWAHRVGLATQDDTGPAQAVVLDRYRETIRDGNDVTVRAGTILNHTPGQSLTLNFKVYDDQQTDLPDDEKHSTSERLAASLTLSAGGYAEIGPFGLEAYQEYSNNIRVIVPLSLTEKELEPVEEVVSHVNLVVGAEAHKQAEEQIDQLLTSMALPYYVNNYAAELEANRNILLVLNVLSYGFIVLISLISVANVFNTISTNIQLRRREFAMLRSVGMTQGGFRKMMNFECLFYGFKALLYGLPVSLAISLWIHAVVYSGVRMDYGLPWGHIAAAVASVFVVVFITMLYAMSKIRKQNIVDQLRNENS